MVRFLLIEPCNFVDYPVGGQLSFAKQLMRAFGDEIALVGYAHDGEPLRQWYKKTINGVTYDYFAFLRAHHTSQKPLIPLRLQNLIGISLAVIGIRSHPCKNWFTQAPEILLVTHNRGLGSNCHMFPGTENPLDSARYAWGKLLARVFDKLLFRALRNVAHTFACADEHAINQLVSRSRGKISRKQIHFFPTRYDSSVFFPRASDSLRRDLGISAATVVFVTTGRISALKGWDLLLSAFRLFRDRNPNSVLYFIGDGEDRTALEQKIRSRNLESSVAVTGFLPGHAVAAYINSSDCYLVGSVREGWSIAMLEALACGKAVVSTNISGASAMINVGVNGYIADNRDPAAYAHLMQKALALNNAASTSIRVASRYRLDTLHDELMNTWSAIR